MTESDSVSLSQHFIFTSPCCDIEYSSSSAYVKTSDDLQSVLLGIFMNIIRYPEVQAMTDSLTEEVADNGKKRKATDDHSPDEIANKKPRMSLFDTVVVQIIVGPDSQVFTIHKGILCKESSYFHAALNNDFREARENKISLPEDSAATFEIFQQWAYSGSFCCDGETNADMAILSLINLYIFAEARGIPKLQNQSLDVIIAGGRIPELRYSWLNIIYDNTCESSPLRKFFAEQYACKMSLKTGIWQSASKRATLPHDFLCDLAIALYDLKQNGKKDRDFWAYRQNYHVLLNTPQDIESVERKWPRSLPETSK